MRYVLLSLVTFAASCAPPPEEPVSAEAAPSPVREPLPEPNAPILELQASPFGVYFHNRGKKPLRMLRPLDGSEDGRVMPLYNLKLVHPQGKDPVMRMGCGLCGWPYSGTKWPDDYLVVIPPGKSRFHPLPEWLYYREGGQYTAEFEYVFLPGKATGPNGEGNVYPPDLWRGKAVSNKLVVTLAAYQAEKAIQARKERRGGS